MLDADLFRGGHRSSQEAYVAEYASQEERPRESKRFDVNGTSSEHSEAPMLDVDLFRGGP